MKIAICDDEKSCRDMAVAVVDAYATAHPEYNISYSAYEWTDDLIDAAGKIGGFDIYILDIVMQSDMNGIQLGLKLRELNYNGKIIYLTSSEEYAIDSFKVKAFNYVTKPIERESFFKALDEVCEVIEKNDKSIIVKTKENSVKLHYDSIMYAELSKRAIVYYLVGGKKIEGTTIRTTFNDAVSELLSDRRFVLCGASMVANLAHVSACESEALVFRDKHKAFLGKKACRDIRARWNEFWFSEEDR